jgi:hypothetical protein
VPVYFNEPISMVQKVAEIMEYQDQLVMADKTTDPVQRIMHVAAFGIAQYKCTDNRLNKPFNPILGETFELKKPDYTYFAEQVSHHPPISACIAESDSYKYHMDTNTTMGISWTGVLTAKPIGYQHVILKGTGEHYLIGRPSTTVNNLIFGTMYIEHVGCMTVKNCKTGLFMNVNFSAAGWGNAGKHEVVGQVYANDQDTKKPLGELKGKWSEELFYNKSKTERVSIWKANPMPDKHDWQYFFTNFTMQLNDLPEGLKDKLPRSDSRLRPDQRALENNDIEFASSEKHRLEEKQRAARKWRAENPGNDFAPKYFKKITDPDSNEDYYAYGPDHGCRDYWEDRRNGDFAHMEDLY